MKEKVEVLISKQELEERISKLADEISKDYEGRDITFICVLKGGVVFLVDLMRKVRQNVFISFMDVSSYGDGTESSGHIKIDMDLDESIEGKDVLIVEDIVDSGRTLSHLKNLLLSRQPRSLKLCALLDKPERRVVDLKADYVGFTIPDKFVVGYGLDYAQRYRNLDFVGVVSCVEE